MARRDVTGSASPAPSSAAALKLHSFRDCGIAPELPGGAAREEVRFRDFCLALPTINASHPLGRVNVRVCQSLTARIIIMPLRARGKVPWMALPKGRVVWPPERGLLGRECGRVCGLPRGRVLSEGSLAGPSQAGLRPGGCKATGVGSGPRECCSWGQEGPGLGPPGGACMDTWGGGTR